MFIKCMLRDVIDRVAILITNRELASIVVPARLSKVQRILHFVIQTFERTHVSHLELTDMRSEICEMTANVTAQTLVSTEGVTESTSHIQSTVHDTTTPTPSAPVEVVGDSIRNQVRRTHICLNVLKLKFLRSSRSSQNANQHSQFLFLSRRKPRTLQAALEQSFKMHSLNFYSIISSKALLLGSLSLVWWM